MPANRERHRQLKRAARTDPQYLQNENKIRRMRYQQRSALRRQLTGERVIVCYFGHILMQFAISQSITSIIFVSFACIRTRMHSSSRGSSTGACAVVGFALRTPSSSN